MLYNIDMNNVFKIGNHSYEDDGCGRYGFTVKDEREVLERFDIEKINFELRDSYNVAPTQEMPIVERHSPNSLNLRKWGVFPAFMKGGMVINATAEKLATSFLWKKAYAESRCIVPFRFFYEWKVLSDGKQPYLIQLKNKELMGFAGLIVTTKDKEGKEHSGYVIITTVANPLMREIHNTKHREPGHLEKYLTQYPQELMEAYPVSSLVNKPQNNFPEILKPLKL